MLGVHTVSARRSAARFELPDARPHCVPICDAGQRARRRWGGVVSGFRLPYAGRNYDSSRAFMAATIRPDVVTAGTVQEGTGIARSRPGGHSFRVPKANRIPHASCRLE